MRQSPMFRDSAMPQPADFYTSLPVATIILSLRVVLTDSFQPFARSVLLPSNRESRFCVDRFTTSLFKSLYFSAIAAFGFYVMKDEKWFPSSLGGSGDFLESLRVFREPPPPALTLSMAIQFAFQLHNLVFLLLLKPFISTTMQIVAHDLIAMLLISAAHLTNYTAGGAIVAFINDASDFFLQSFFLATASGRKSVIAPLLVMLAFARVPSRRSLQLHCGVATRESGHVDAVPAPAEHAVHAAVGLHIYWLFAFGRKGIDELRKSPSKAAAEADSTSAATKTCAAQ